MLERLPKRIKHAAVAGAALIAHTFSANAQNVEKHVENKIGDGPYITYSKTADGNERFVYNPSMYNIKRENADSSVHYLVGATESPFLTLEEMKEKTEVPKHLTETDFFTNYINTKFETPKVNHDEKTGNAYFDYLSVDPRLQGVPFEGDKHWNIQRFLVQPHFNNFPIEAEEGQRNATYDMYKYFLYTEKGDRDTAWKKATEFIEREVAPIINSKYFAWAKENYPILNWRPGSGDSRFLNADHTLFEGTDHGEHFALEDNSTDLPNIILAHNKKVLDGEIKGPLYTKQAIIDLLIDYNIVYRKKTPQEALDIATYAVESAEKKYRDEESAYLARPLVEKDTVISMPDFPPDFSSWDEELQFMWLNDPANKDKLGKIERKFTEQDRQKALNGLKNFRFLEH